MLRLALKMLMGDRAKYAGLIFGITFTSFLVTFAFSYFCGFMTRGFALIAENPVANVWVMDPAVESPEQTINLPDSALNRVRSIEGVNAAWPLALSTAVARFPNGRFQPFQVICADDATLAGVPALKDGASPAMLRAPDAVIVDPGGTDGKLETPILKSDQWPSGEPHLNAPTRELAVGDELLINDRRVLIRARSDALPRYPPLPLLYTTFPNCARILLPEPHLLTFVLATAAPGVFPSDLAARIHDRTGLKARSSEDFKADTVRWFLINSEDVGDIAAMLSLAMSVGFGVTGVMLYMFTNESLKQYAVLKAMGASSRLLLTMILAQAGLCALLGTGLGLGLCGIVGQLAIDQANYPFRMMWFTPVVGAVMVLLVSLVAAAISARPVLKLEPGVVFAGR
ncbi:MAG: ABC transporter permease [Acidipila sp.]|nr:ABC transporter permease [Acidipila sp.]